ncbi:C1 family peptidase [Raoultibacter timonensis]|uniref:C1 family peptidase n=1 Tax=Raoultibacter timonensis TaxID=1907662 RepID=UPI0011AF29FD|nr:C1 family peptidase [Raoultibacter timonensis]
MTTMRIGAARRSLVLLLALALAFLLACPVAGVGPRGAFADEPSSGEDLPQDALKPVAPLEETRLAEGGHAAAPDRFEPNDTAAQATDTGFPARVEATVHSADDVDWYAIDPEDTGEVALMLTSPVQAAYRMRLCDESGVTLRESSFESGLQSIRCAVGDGRYYVVVESLDGAFDPANPYTLDMQRHMEPASVSSLDLSEMNMLTALNDSASGFAWDYGVNGGGHFLMSQAYFSQWAGPVAESDDPYSAAGPFEYRDLGTQSPYHVQNALYLPSGQSASFLDDLKAAVMTYGAADIYVLWALCYATQDNTHLFVDKRDFEYQAVEDGVSYDGGHIVTVVGWDDTYSKDRFEGNPYALDRFGYTGASTPKPHNDGALICKNSWGDDAGEGGYFYVSYEDAFIGTNNPTVFMAGDSSESYNHQYLNDPYGTNLFWTSDEAFTASEVFVNRQSERETLRAVSFSIGSAARYEIAVTTNGQTETVATGEKRYGGYYTVHLGDAAAIEPGDAFRIDVTVRPAAQGDKVRMGVSANVPGEISGIVEVSGRAFIDEGGTVTDVGEQGFYPSIRAYTDDPASGGGGQDALYGRAASPVADGVDAQVEACAEVGLRQRDPLGEDEVRERTEDSIAVTSVNPELYGGIGVRIDGSAGDSAIDPLSLAADLPSSFDLRREGTLTPVRNQGDLGSCWTFAAMACAENYLARTDANVTGYPRSLSLSRNKVSLDLSAGEEAPVELTAVLEGSENLPLSTVAWSVTGDVGSVRLETGRSTSGEAVTVLTALKPGTVTVRAESDADMSVAAQCVVTISSGGSQGVEPLPTPNVDQPDRQVGSLAAAGDRAAVPMAVVGSAAGLAFAAAITSYAVRRSSGAKRSR